MKNIKSMIAFFLAAALSVCLFTGCGKTDAKMQDEAIQNAVNEAVEEAVKEALQEQNAQKEEPAQPASAEEAVDYGYTHDDEPGHEAFTFADIENLVFNFSSGVGAWSTNLYVTENGSFYGSYKDEDMGDTGAKYPNGTIYYCDFAGQFMQPVKLNDYTYLVGIESIEYTYDVGTDDIMNGAHYMFTEPYGLEGASEVYFYLPGAPIEELPRGFIEWVGYYDYDSSKSEEEWLPFYGLYNAEKETGFTSYEADEYFSEEERSKEKRSSEKQYTENEMYGTEDTASVDDRLSSAKYSEKELLKKLEKDDIEQWEMNEIAAQIYQIWDDELNWIWDEMGARLDASVMGSLQNEQREWLAKRENEMRKAGAEFEGGSMQPTVEYNAGSEMTEKRAYELANYLR